MLDVASQKSINQIKLEFEELRARLEDAEQTLEAIRTGEVDALVVYGNEGQKVYTLKGADEPYRVFVEQIREGAVTLDASGLILYCNQRMADMVGQALENVIGSYLIDFVSLPDRAGFEELLSVSSEAAPRRELVLIRRDNEIPVQISIAPLSPELTATFALTITDLTEQKKHEQELQAANEELEGFCYSVSHDLRTPLRSMVSSARLLIEDFGKELSPPAEDRLRRIESSAIRLAHLIDDLLSFARLGRRHIQLQSVDLTAVAERVSIEVSNDAPQVRFDIEPNMRVEADEQLLYIVLQNLMSNAVKFSKQSSDPSVRVGSTFRNGLQTFFVSDNGIGFDMLYAEKIFKPFERLHPGDIYPGNGIGLANAERIVGRHDGKLWTESTPGHGATFFFTLPSA